MLTILLIKGLLAAVIVGFVTASIQSWVDRFFLVILLVGMLGMTIKDAITTNLIVVSLVALMMALRQSEILRSVRQDWGMIVIPAVIGAILGRVFVLNLNPTMLLAVLGAYVLLVGLRLAFIRPVPAKETSIHPVWLAPVSFGAALLTGVHSAGGKVFQVPLYNLALGRHPKQAYALAAPVALATQVSMGYLPSTNQILLAFFLFIFIVGIALIVQRFWTPRLNQWVTWLIAPILFLVGVRFLWMALL